VRVNNLRPISPSAGVAPLHRLSWLGRRAQAARTNVHVVIVVIVVVVVVRYTVQLA
jgi:hypothetical protein